MLRSCKWCGRIHDSKHDCGRKPKPYREYKDKDAFRSTAVWQRKREEIRERDQQLCQICIRKLYGTVRQYTYNNLSVHHAVSVEDAWDKRLDNDNLLTMCERHHSMAERKEIPLSVIKDIISEQIPPPVGERGKNNASVQRTCLAVKKTVPKLTEETQWQDRPRR